MPFYKASLSNVASMNVASMIVAGFLIAASFAFATPGYAQTIKSFQKISDLQGGFAQAGGMLEKNDDFGEQVDNIGDVDGDGVNDLVVGVNFDDDGGENRGAVYILFMNTNGTVKALQKISSTQGGFTETGGVLDDFDSFSRGATGLGDLDNDGVPDIAVGAPNDDDTGPFGGGSSNNGAVYILFLNTDGTVKSQQKISEEQGGLNRNVFRMGGDLEMLGDIDGDGVEDLFVQNSGGFYLLFLNTDGTVKSSSNLFSQSGSGGFGQTGALIGDLDGDGVMDIATGAQFDDDGGNNQGAVWILFMNSDGTERQRVKISATQGGFTGLLEPLDEFGQSVSPIGDHNGDGIPDLLVGAEHADSPDGSLEKTGEAWILHLNRDGTVQSHELMRSGSENFTTLEANADFGQAVTYLGDLDGDGVGDIVVASDGDRDCNVCGGNKGTMTGAVYVLFLQGEPGNRQPELTNIPNETVVESDLLTINIMATDDDMDPLILTASELTDKDGMPVMGAMFTDFTDGTGSFSWTPGMGAAALSPYTVTFTATEDTMDALFDSQPVTIFVNDGSGGGPPVTYEFESLTVAASDGTTTSAIKSDASASNGQYFQYNSNAVGEFVTFAVPITSPGANVFDIQYHLARYRGTFMVEVAETLGGPYTQIGVMNTTVNSGSAFPTLTTMPATFISAGTKYVRFTATGSNPNTGSERMGLDKIDVIPQGGGGGNVAPVLADISNPSVTELDPVMIPVMATDDDMDPLILTASELTDKDGMPVMGAMFTDFTDGTGSFSWTPGMGAALLSPYTVTFTATEDTMAGKSDMLIVTIFVNDGSGGGPPVTYEFESLTMAASDGTTSSAIKSNASASNGQYFQYNSNAVGEFVTFPIDVSAPGAYDLDLQYHLARYRGTFMVEVAETLGGTYTQIGVMNTTVNSGSSFPTLSMTATFASAGTKYVRFTATGSNPNTGSERIALDKLDVTAQ